MMLITMLKRDMILEKENISIVSTMLSLMKAWKENFLMFIFTLMTSEDYNFYQNFKLIKFLAEISWPIKKNMIISTIGCLKKQI